MRSIEAIPTMDDNPELDATDGAHPAWWRGYDYGSQQWRGLAIDTLTNTATLLDNVKSDWMKDGSWTPNDQGIRDGITMLLEYLECVAREKQATTLAPAIVSPRLTEQQVRERLSQECEKAGTQKAWALRHDVSEQYVCDVLAGRRDPGDAICSALNLKRLQVYELA